MNLETENERQRLLSEGYEYVRADRITEGRNGKGPDVVLLEQACYNGMQTKVFCEIYARKAGLRVARITPGRYDLRSARRDVA